MSLATLSRVALLACLTSMAASIAIAQSRPPVTTYDNPVWHRLPNGQPDPGTTTPGAGGTTTTFQDGWTRQTEPDNSFTPPGTKTTIKDNQGRIREIIKSDAELQWRHQTLVDPENFTTTDTHWNADGSVDSTRTVDDPKKQPKKVERWNPAAGRYESLASSSSWKLDGATVGLVAIVFMLGMLCGRNLAAHKTPPPSGP